MKRTFFAFITMLTCLIFTACSADSNNPSAPQVQSGSISGHISEYTGDAGIADVVVAIGTNKVHTDAAGNYTIKNLEAGQTVTIKYSKTGYQDITRKTKILLNVDKKIDISLIKYISVDIPPATDNTITIPGVNGTPKLDITANTIVDENNVTPASATVNVIAAHHRDDDFALAMSNQAYTADSAGITVKLAPQVLVDFNLESGAKGRLSIKTGKTASVSADAAKQKSSEHLHLFYFDNNKFVYSTDTLLTNTSTGQFTAKVSKTGKWLIAKIADNNSPIAQITATPSSGTTNTEFLFDARSSFDPDNDQLQARWCFNYSYNMDSIAWDTGYSSDLTATHQYKEPGNYLVKLEIKDCYGYISHAVIAIEVVSANPSEERLSAETDSVWSNGSWQEAVKFKYSYNGSLAIKRVGQVNDNGTYRDSVMGIVLAYDYNNKPTHTENRVWTGSSWLTNMVMKRTYNSQGLITLTDITEDIDSLVKGYRGTFNYSNSNLISAERFYKNTAGQYLKFADYQLSYSKGNLAEMYITSFSGPDTSRIKYTYIYNPDNTLKTIRKYSLYDNVWQEFEYTEISYSYGKISTAQTFTSYSGSVPTLIESYEYIYSGNLMIRRSFSDMTNGSLSTNWEHNYRYNSSGHLIFEEELHPRNPDENERYYYTYESGQGNMSSLQMDNDELDRYENPFDYNEPFPVK